jgi:hypothetical protein
MKDELKAEDANVGTQAAASSDSSLIPPPSSFHQIRLGPPWQVTATDTGSRHARRFGRPRTLDADERLWLVCEHVPAPAEVRVNDTAVDPPTTTGPFAADITSLLLPRNEVAFIFASDGPLGAVALEVRPA